MGNHGGVPAATRSCRWFRSWSPRTGRASRTRRRSSSTSSSCFPSRRSSPADAALGFLSALIEEYADEWGNKPMFHYRWWYPPDQKSAAERIARAMMPGAADDAVQKLAALARAAHDPAPAGSSARTPTPRSRSRRPSAASSRSSSRISPRARTSSARRPRLADFGLFAQLYECSTRSDPGSRDAQERAARRWPGSSACWRRSRRASSRRGRRSRRRWSRCCRTRSAGLPALVDGEREGAGAPSRRSSRSGWRADPFRQQTQKYHARSLAALKQRYARLADRRALDAVLARTGCLAWLQAA